ncbi:Nramp family divalent metal transporter [Roseiterribacter gracilis]|uniref:Divalent metal cation transporter MntH n=1 Tax=Roseiterribacter gracilis TaxID=2812848 RepID=A0A8S8XGB4_9PROT|nr:divalent metal cation transporter MntH [Rhodospirillales bacterium TMPK1]
MAKLPDPGTGTLGAAHASIPVTGKGAWRLLAFLGPGYLVSVGYMDPGNWATDLAGGSAYGTTLLSVILLSNLMAVLLQALSLKLGIASGLDLAQACRARFSRPVAISLWLLAEVAICACDLAEVIGTAIALQLLFGLPLVQGVVLTAANVLVILWLQSRGFRRLEAFVIALIAIVFVAFVIQLIFAGPSMGEVLLGFIPDPRIITDPAMLYVAIGILGATVMPHNLYLHSSIVQTRAYVQDEAGKRDAIRWATWDSTIALSFALLVNAAILILAASTFHTTGRTEVAEIQEAHALLTPLLGTSLASTLFAVALLASGQNSTITATLAGQIVMEGFVNLRMKPWARQLLTRGLAIIPAAIVASFYGESGTAKLLVLSQVVLSLQLPFAVIPLVIFTADKKLMGHFKNRRLTTIVASIVAALIVVLNAKLLWDVVTG